MVSDSGGFDDHSFNQIGLEGLQAAAKDLGVKEKHVQSNSDDDYAPNIESLLSSGCNLIVTVGFLLSNATDAAAKANPDVKFAIVDDGLDNEGATAADGSATGDGKVDVANGKPILFDTAQAAFLAGYAAASYSKTGVVGTFGGIQIPPVTIFMDGFVDGVQKFNEDKSKNVATFGWDVAKQTGAFTGGFAANDTAKQTASGILDQGVDVILPVGGPIFQSAAAAITDSGKDTVLLGVDADLYETAPDIKSMVLVSILKRIDNAVHDAVVAAGTGKFDATPYVGTLENEGVGLSSFHDFESKLPAGLTDELDALKKAIIDGSLQVTSPSSPK
jgi:basic membrane protein A